MVSVRSDGAVGGECPKGADDDADDHPSQSEGSDKREADIRQLLQELQGGLTVQEFRLDVAPLGGAGHQGGANGELKGPSDGVHRRDMDHGDKTGDGFIASATPSEKNRYDRVADGHKEGGKNTEEDGAGEFVWRRRVPTDVDQPIAEKAANATFSPRFGG